MIFLSIRYNKYTAGLLAGLFSSSRVCSAGGAASRVCCILFR